jgi:tetratricopeptide (TPR) repeat protein
VHEPKETAHPTLWQNLLLDDLDFESAFDSLEGHFDYYTEAVRGYVRTQQGRLEEAWRFLRSAERLYRRTPQEARSPRLYFSVRLFAIGAAMREEAAAPSFRTAAKTDRLVLRFSELFEPDDRIFDEIRIFQISLYKIMRSDFREAYNALMVLLQGNPGEFDDRFIAYYCAAAVAAHELDMTTEAERFLESARLGISMTGRRFKVALYGSWLYTILSHWGRHEEAGQYMAMLESLDCPAASRRCFVEHAKILAAACAAGDQVFFMC